MLQSLYIISPVTKIFSRQGRQLYMKPQEKKNKSNVSTLQILTSMDQSRQNTFVNQKHITVFGTQNFNFSQTWNIMQVMTQMAQHTFLTK